jgi:hypothetical protein
MIVIAPLRPPISSGTKKTRMLAATRIAERRIGLTAKGSGWWLQLEQLQRSVRERLWTAEGGPYRSGRMDCYSFTVRRGWDGDSLTFEVAGRTVANRHTGVSNRGANDRRFASWN